jgi:hypothetical protein
VSVPSPVLAKSATEVDAETLKSYTNAEQMTQLRWDDGNGYRRPINQLTVAFHAFPSARWGPLFQVPCIEQPGMHLQ